MKRYDSLIRKLKDPVSFKQPVILPDFFLDHFVMAESFDSFVEGLEGLAKQGGGNLLGSRHLIRRGGNSANTAVALHALGAKPILIVTTDEQGKKLLESLVHPDLNLQHVHTDGRLSATVSIELDYEGRRVNLMVSDSGSASSFGFDELNEEDLEAIANSGLVCLLNLNHNSKAFELARDLFQYTRESSNAITFLDIGDPSGNPERLIDVLRHVVGEGLVDILGLNENEASWCAWALGGKDASWRSNVRDPSSWLLGAQYVAKETGVRIDMHTPHYSATLKEEQVTALESFKVEPKILCGAGDAWNAGAVFGYLSNLSDLERLALANAISSLYVSMGTAAHPNRNQVISFLESIPEPSVDGTKLLKLQ